MASEVGPVNIERDRLTELLASDCAAELLGGGYLSAIDSRNNVISL
jgi:hypothetical protein